MPEAVPRQGELAFVLFKPGLQLGCGRRLMRRCDVLGEKLRLAALPR